MLIWVEKNLGAVETARLSFDERAAEPG